MASVIREVAGFNSKFAIYNLVIRNLKLRYRKSALGLLWTMLIPAFNAVVFYFAFQVIFRAQIPHYLMFLMSGIVFWNFFNQSVLMGLESIVGHHSILNKVPVAPSIFPLSEVLGNFINLGLSFPILVIVAFFFGSGISYIWLYALPWIFLLFLQAYFLGLWCGVLFIFFRDLRHIAVIVLQAWFYMTPVVYEGSMVPKSFEFIKILNPVWLIFNHLHSLLLNSVQPRISQDFLISMLWTLIVGVAGTGLYALQRKSIVEKL